MSKRKSFLIILAIICLVMVSTLSVIKAALLHSNGEINSLSGKTTNNPDFTIKEKTETKADNKTKLQRVNEDLLALLKENNINLEGCSSTVVEDLDYILVQVKKEDIETVKKLASDFEAKTGVCVSVKKQLAELPDGHENSGSFNQTKLVLADGMLMQSFYQNCVGIVYPDWFGNIIDQTFNDTTGNHAVVVYGYTYGLLSGYSFVAHFGWTNATEVYYTGILGSVYTYEW